MRFSDVVKEAFDKPYPYEWNKDDFGDYHALAFLDDGSPLELSFGHEGDDQWHVTFDRNFKFDVTGEGDQQRVFATVLAGVKDFVQQRHPQKIIFSATKSVKPGQKITSRAGLYNSLVNRYAAALGYTAQIDDRGDQVVYTLSRIVKQPVAEGSNESKVAAMEKKLQDMQNRLELTRERRKMRGQRIQSTAEIKLAAKMSELRQQIHQLKSSVTESASISTHGTTNGGYTWRFEPSREVPFKTDVAANTFIRVTDPAGKTVAGVWADVAGDSLEVEYSQVFDEELRGRGLYTDLLKSLSKHYDVTSDTDENNAAAGIYRRLGADYDAGQARHTLRKQGVAEGGAETSWSHGTEKITLQDILELTNHIKQINLPINDNLKSKLIHWDGNSEEIERINQVIVSKQFPILIIVDEQGQIQSILDGNHRLHRAIKAQAKTIPAKLIKPSDLNDKAKRILHINEQGVAEGKLNFEEGDCPIFAIALHRLSKMPLMALVEYDEQMGSTVLVHAYVKLDDRWRLDASGETDVDWMLQKYPNNGNAEEIEISEKDLLELGYGKSKCPTLQQVLPHAKEVLQNIEEGQQGVAEGSDQNYLSQIPNLTWKPVSRSVWNTIQDEGLNEEQDAPNHTDWVMSKLTISPKDSQALQAFDNDAIEDFNRFDIHLKSRYPGLTDLIDYDRGTVTIVKTVTEQGVAEGRKKKKKKTSRYFGGYFFPGYGYYGSGESDEGGGEGESVAEGINTITEYRDRMYQYIKSIVPNWPDYVVKDWLYANFARGATQGPNWSFHTIGKDLPNIIRDVGLSVDTKWQLIPNLKFTMNMWEPKTLNRLQERAGGSSNSTDPDVHIPARDAERHATQAVLAKQQGGVRKEPVILIKRSNGYELAEGWHRTIQHFHMYPNGYTGPAYVAVAQDQQVVAEGAEQPDLMSAFRDFLPIAMRELDIDKLPPIRLLKQVPAGDQPTFGKFNNQENVIHLGIAERHPVDILRTLAHELVHYKQNTEHQLAAGSGKTGSPEENQAHEVAGVVMRDFNRLHPEYFAASAVELTEDRSDYEIRNRAKLDNILVNLCRHVVEGQRVDPDRYGMVAACVVDPDNRQVIGVNELTADGTRRHGERVAMERYQAQYGDIPKGSIIVTTCSPCNEEHMTERYGESCTDIINNSNCRKVYCGYQDPSQTDEHNEFTMEVTGNADIVGLCEHFAATFLNENFADGKGPGRPGDSVRHGIPKNATMAELERASRAKGRKGQLARWQLNMRRGRKK